MDDEALMVWSSQQFLEGKRPYLDWNSRATTLSYALNAAYFYLFGCGQLATRSLMGVISSLTGLVILACSRRLVGDDWRAYLPWLLWTAIGIYEKPALNYHWHGCLFTCLTLLALQCWIARPPQKEDGWRSFGPPLVAGSAAALAFWCLQSNGLSACLMVALVWIRLRPRGLSALLIAYFSTQLLLWLPWLPHFSQAWSQHFGILGRHTLFNRQPYSLQHLSDLATSYAQIPAGTLPVHWLAAWSHFSDLVLRYGLFFVVIGLALVKAERSKEARWLVVAYSGLAWTLTLGYCLTPSYLSYASPIVYLLAPALLGSRLPKLMKLWALWVVLGWLVRAFSMQAAFIYPVNFRTGQYKCADQQQAASLTELHGWLQSNCPEQSSALAFPYFPSLYTLWNIHNPTPEPILLPWLWEESCFQSARQKLEQAGFPYIIVRKISLPAVLDEYSSVPRQEFMDTYQIEWNRLSEGYGLVWENASYQVWKHP